MKKRDAKKAEKKETTQTKQAFKTSPIKSHNSQPKQAKNDPYHAVQSALNSNQAQAEMKMKIMAMLFKQKK